MYLRRIPYRFRKSGFSRSKTVPLGQMAGQRILWHLHGRVPQAVEKALKLKDEQLSSALPRYAMLSMKHETQYSRLFRS